MNIPGKLLPVLSMAGIRGWLFNRHILINLNIKARHLRVSILKGANGVWERHIY